jgi:electron transport complex protein RnfB
MSPDVPAGELYPIVTIIAALACIFVAAWRQRQATVPLAERIDRALPQTQCKQCGFAGCAPYAQAIASGRAPINRCPPGGESVIRKLARLTGEPVIEPDRACGSYKPRHIAVIDEQDCIGCTLCIQACPVDAIVGAAKLMHTVIRSECTGCELCLPPCPVDCIRLEPAPWTTLAIVAGKKRQAQRTARRRFEQRAIRLERNKREHARRLAAKAAERLARLESQDDGAAQTRKRAIIEAALARARTRLAHMR